MLFAQIVFDDDLRTLFTFLWQTSQHFLVFAFPLCNNNNIILLWAGLQLLLKFVAL